MSRIKFLFIIIMLMMLTAGCGTKQTQDTKNPASLQVGIIDMNKAIKAHPNYNQLMELGKQADTLAAQLEAQQHAAAKQVQMAQSSAAQGEMQEVRKAFEQEFNAKIADKQSELNPRLAEKENEARHAAAKEIEAYNNQLDKEYQPQIFNLTLKLNNTQLSKEEIASLQAEIEKFKTQRAQALEAKQKSLVTRIHEIMAPEKAVAEQEMASYSKQLHEEISQKIAAKQAEISARMSNRQVTSDSDQGISETQQQFIMKKQEFQALQENILGSIKGNTEKVAKEEGLEAVFTNISVNVNAADITAKVIAECNK